MAALYAIAALLTVVSGAAFLLLHTLHQLRKPPTGQHVAGPYIPTTNPFRLGSTVLVCEDPARPENNFYGTLLSTRGRMVTIRDTAAPFHTVETEKDYIFPAGTNLGW